MALLRAGLVSGTLVLNGQGDSSSIASAEGESLAILASQGSGDSIHASIVSYTLKEKGSSASAISFALALGTGAASAACVVTGAACPLAEGLAQATVYYDGTIWALDCVGRGQCNGESSVAFGLDLVFLGMERGAGRVLRAPYLDVPEDLIKELRVSHKFVDAQIGVGLAVSSQVHQVESGDAEIQFFSNISGVVNLG